MTRSAKKIETAPQRHVWPTLYKATVGGRVAVWTIQVAPTPQGAEIAVEYGLEDGKKIRQKEAIVQGKNLGKANETSPWQQAMLQAEATFRKQRDRKGYGESPAVSASIRSVSPMLAQPIQKQVARIDWGTAFAQPKLDGFRCLAVQQDGAVKLYSREGQPITTMPHVVEELQGRSFEGIIDGELYAHGMTLNQISSAVKRQKTRADHADQVKYHIYDVIQPGRYEHRLEYITAHLGAAAEYLELVTTVVVRSRDELEVCEYEFLEAGYEGAMLRHGREGYEAGKRSPYLLKVKQFVDGEFEIIDIKQGRGTHDGMAIYICQTAEGHVFDVTAPGSHEEKRRAWSEGTACVGKRLTVKYARMTATREPVPFHPTAVRIRERAGG